MKIFFFFSDPPKDVLVSPRKAVVGQTILSVKPMRRTRNLAYNYTAEYTAMIGEMILNNALVPQAECFIYSF